jgi:high-affinity Fe2+/Pb2+ permease
VDQLKGQEILKKYIYGTVIGAVIGCIVGFVVKCAGST